jgi:enoyl-[acyl-carrier protein] reductase II
MALRRTSSLLLKTTSNQHHQPPISTLITDLFECHYPIVLPGMSWISTPELVAAVSNAGGVGILATGPLTAEETQQSIDQIKSLTDRPFGIGATLLMPGATENAKVAIDNQVPIVNISLGKADWIADSVHAYGGKVLATVTNRKHGHAALQSGADALMVTGHEAAAHGGDVTSLVLIPSLRHEFPNTPIVAAGGFATGRGLAGALNLGADAVAMGSRLAVTVESPLAAHTKQVIVQSGEDDTVYGSNFDGIPARVLKTPHAVATMRSRPWWPTIAYRALQAARHVKLPLWKVLPGLLTQFDKMFVIAQFGAATQAIMAATVDGKVGGSRGSGEEGIQFIGQSQGMIQDIPHVDAFIQSIIQEARQVSKETARRLEYPCDDEDDVEVRVQ